MSKKNQWDQTEALVEQLDHETRKNSIIDKWDHINLHSLRIDLDTAAVEMRQVEWEEEIVTDEGVVQSLDAVQAKLNRVQDRLDQLKSAYRGK